MLPSIALFSTKEARIRGTARVSSVSHGMILVFINGMGPLCCSSSLRSEVGSQLGAAPPEEEAEFPAVCSGE